MNEVITQVVKTLKMLPDSERMALALYYMEHLNLDEIGLVLNISQAAVERLMASSLKKLRVEIIKGTNEESCTETGTGSNSDTA